MNRTDEVVTKCVFGYSTLFLVTGELLINFLPLDLKILSLADFKFVLIVVLLLELTVLFLQLRVCLSVWYDESVI